VALAEQALRLRAPDVDAQLAATVEDLVRGHHLAEAAAVARLQGRRAWAGSQYQEALAAVDRSAQLAEAAGDRTLKTKALLGVFTLLLELGDLRGARLALQEAARGADSVDPETRLILEFDRGQLAAAEEQPREAQAAFREVLRAPSAKATSEMSWNASLNLLSLAVDARDLPAADAAAAMVDKVFAQGEFHDRPSSRIARGLYTAQLERLRGQPAAAIERLTALAADKPSPQWSWLIALERGRALADLKQTDAAITALEESTAVVEALRGDQFDDFKSWVLAQRRAPYQALFEIHVARNDALAALQILERVQGRTFLEAFAARTLPDGEGQHSTAPRRIEWLKRLYPALRASPVLAAPPLSAAELQTRTRGMRGIAFFEGKDRMYVIALHDGRVRVLPSPQPLPAIRRLVAQLLAAPGDRLSAENLSAALLPEGALPPGNASADGMLFVAPSTLLARVPFAALRHRGRYLTQDHVLAQIPSFNALAVLRQLGAGVARAPMILANASLDLPDAEAEARAVAGRLSTGRGGAKAALPRVYLGRDAVTDRLREARGASVLHLALHSGVGVTGPWLGLGDRKLLASEVLDWHLAADLVVLASCASAATPDPGLWGSLVASFLASGSPSVVGSLWSTKDQVSRQFVERFYDEGGTRDPALALAHAQRAWLAEGRPVGVWAAFAFYGPGRRR
jgi:tetratricopeptide (TPR) repeat protein